MQWERLSMYKQVTQVTGVAGKQLPMLKELKGSVSPEELAATIKKIRKTAREGNYRAQCVMGFLCCLGYAKKRAHKKLYGSAVGRLDGPCGPGGVLLYAIGDDYYHVAGARQDLEEAAVVLPPARLAPARLAPDVHPPAVLSQYRSYYIF